MASKKSSENSFAGVIGSGSFGTAVANLLAENGKVLIYARRAEVADAINKDMVNRDQQVHKNVNATNDLREVCERCKLLFPTVPSVNFRRLMREMAPYLLPSHIIIHGTKGLDINIPKHVALQDVNHLNRDCIHTMSEVIEEETVVVRIGCLAGPNLAGELAQKQPAAAVIASRFDEVIEEGKKALRSKRFIIYGNKDITGVELAGTLKNIIAIAAGALGGLGYGENAKALLISKGIAEMIRIGQALGGDKFAFLGLAGIGDMVATSSSNLSRNYQVGFRLAKGESLKEIIESSQEVAEGVSTVQVAKKLTDYYKVRAPIVQVVHRVLFEKLTVQKGLSYLMEYPFDVDVDFA